MKVLHLTGHFQKWNLDSHYENEIGDGFVFCAYSFENGFFDKPLINGYKTEDILEKSFFDLQYFGQKDAGSLEKGKLKTYKFHPAANANDDEKTNVLIEGLIKKGVHYQIETLGLKNIIVPNYYENDNFDHFIGMVININQWLKTNKKEDIKYFMTVPISFSTVEDDTKIERLLFHLTGREIIFDGYYIMCESKTEFKQKINLGFKYMKNLSTVLKILKKQKFETILAYANWDAIIYLALTDIDYITIGTYENLRNFRIKRFTENEDGGPSKGWYFSEPILNFIKSPLLDLLRIQKALPLVRNEKNIFSDAILVDGYPWSNQKPEVHKNYLLAIDNLLKELAAETDLKARKALLISKIDYAISIYQKLQEKGVYLTDESRNYHLNNWRSFLLSQN